MDKRFIDAVRTVLKHSLEEASRAQSASTSAYEIVPVDLVTAIVREPDILAHLVADRECVIDFGALRAQRSGRARVRRPRDTESDEPHAVVRLVQGYSGEVKQSNVLRQAMEDASNEIAALTAREELAFLRLAPHDERIRMAREQMAAAGFDPDPRQTDDIEWLRKVDARNYRYAALRALFEHALAADPQGVSAALGTLGLGEEALQFTFESLAAHLSWPNLDA